MSKKTIEVNNVSKAYDIRQMNRSTFRDLFRLRRSDDANTLWALKDVSFAVEEGEAVGIIGANGSGKTTMLRLLAGVSSQTSGEINVDGRLAPLIQVGAGFHPELTGRENVYLNGTILGLSKKEIDNKYDEIVQFAELEKFMDTPVKKYSSGMFVRLGFSVAIHVEAEILLIDEILSVGDISFQRKCLERMSNIRRSKKSIVFVSHNLSAVRGLCARTIWLDHGVVQSDGKTEEVISKYAQFMASKSQFTNDTSFIGAKTRWGTGELKFNKVEIFNAKDELASDFEIGDPLKVMMDLDVQNRIKSPVFWVGIINNEEVWITGSVFDKQRAGKDYAIEGRTLIVCTFNDLRLQPGEYHLVVGGYDEYEHFAFDRIGRVESFRVLADSKNEYENYRGYEWQGVVPMVTTWRFHDK